MVDLSINDEQLILMPKSAFVELTELLLMLASQSRTRTDAVDAYTRFVNRVKEANPEL